MLFKGPKKRRHSILSREHVGKHQAQSSGRGSKGKVGKRLDCAFCGREGMSLARKGKQA